MDRWTSLTWPQGTSTRLRLSVSSPSRETFYWRGLEADLGSQSEGSGSWKPISYGQKTHPRFRGRGVYPTEASCRFPLIVLQQTTQSFFATHNSVVPARLSIRQWE